MKRFMCLSALLWASPVLADGAGEAKVDPKGEDDKVTEKAGGKFSLLGMECKAEEEPGLETTPGSPPLDVDDPATPGCNGWEINIVTTGEFGKAMTGETPLFDINYGVGDNLQLKAEVPYEFTRIDGVSHTGLGRGELGLKYRFYEDDSRGLSIAVYPQLEFAIPGTAAAEGDQGVGTTTKLPLLLSTRIGETSKGPVMVTANLGYNHSTVPGSEDYVAAAVGVGFPVLSSVALMVETSTEQAVRRNMEDVRERYFKANVGVIGGISEHLLWFGSVGQTFASSDMADSSHTCVSLGLRLIAGGP